MDTLEPFTRFCKVYLKLSRHIEVPECLRLWKCSSLFAVLPHKWPHLFGLFQRNVCHCTKSDKVQDEFLPHCHTECRARAMRGGHGIIGPDTGLKASMAHGARGQGEHALLTERQTNTSSLIIIYLLKCSSSIGIGFVIIFSYKREVVFTFQTLNIGEFFTFRFQPGIPFQGIDSMNAENQHDQWPYNSNCYLQGCLLL